MTPKNLQQDVEWLRSRVAALEQLQEVQEKAVLEQSERLERSVAELRRQKRILQAVLDSMSDGVAVADENGKFLLFNPAAERILGFGASDAPPEQWSERYGCFLSDGETPYPADQMPLMRAIRGEEVDDAIEFIRNANRPEGVW